ncbi:aldo/keto reductase [Tessaracoccus coleopterorum]|uniref:aldo/keto reductase n=1 Tax=Tessaracoccus coleopterorum TaxID=2714950 RepID=UPI002F907919
METYQQICDHAGHSMLDVTFAWMLSRPGIASVIAGATRISQASQNAAAGRAHVSPEVVEAVDRLFKP